MRGIAARGCLALIVLLCVALCLTRLAEVDFYWHLLEGRRILETGQVPRQDDLSFTSAGRSWVDMQWLFEAIVAAIDRRAGLAGLDLLKVGLIAGGFVLAMTSALRRASPMVVGVFALPAVVAAQERFTLRPEAASFFMLGAMLLLIGERRSRPKRLGLAPPLIALWANLHALYAVGLGALLLAAAGDGLEALRGGALGGPAGGQPPPRTRPLILASSASIAAALLTPYGLRGWGLPARLLFERLSDVTVYGAGIAEFRSPFRAEGFSASIGAFAFLAVLSGGAALACPRRERSLTDGLLLAAFLTLALLARRNMALFALAALATAPPLAAAALRRADEEANRGRPEGGRSVPRLLARVAASLQGAARRARPVGATLLAAATLVVIVDVITNRFFARDATQRYFGRGEAPGFYPHAAAGFVLAQGIEGEVLNDLTSGGFLAWRWFPVRRVFIDGRLEVHGEDLFIASLRLRQDPAFFEQIARRYGVSTVLWSHRESAASAPLLRYLASGHGWKLRFVDLSAAVFVHEGAGRRDLGGLPDIDTEDPRIASRILDELREEEARSANLDPLPAFLRRALPWRDVPVALSDAAIFFAVTGSRPPAERLFREALSRDPGNPVLCYDLGVLLDRAGDQAGARRAYEEALALRGDYAPAREALALLLLRNGDADGALAQWALAERSARLGQASLEARAAIRARRGQVDEAIEDYRELVRAEPGRSDARSDLALLYLRAGLGQRALDEVGRALALDPRASRPRVVLARIRAERGEAAAAERIYREVIADDAGCVEARLGLAVLLASSGRPEEALAEMAAAVRSGADLQALSGEPALRGLIDTPGFRTLMERRGTRSTRDSPR